MQTDKDLRQQLIVLEGRFDKAYKSIKGEYLLPEFTLKIDPVQGDPFSAPSRFRAEIADCIMKGISEKGLDTLTKEKFGDLAYFRRFEWAVALNRLRSLKVLPTEENEAEID